MKMGRLDYSVLVLALTFAVGDMAKLPPHPVNFIPTLYVTGMPERPNAEEVIMYVANICNTILYPGYIIVRVNLPSGWSPAIGYLAKLEVCSTLACDATLCSNYIKGVFNGQHDCSFAYDTIFKEIFVRVTAGPAPNIDWTVALEFISKSQYFATRMEDAMYYDVPEPIGRNDISPNDVKVLSQIVPPGTHHTVTTLNRIDFSMSFCPDNQTTQRYNINIVVTALDSRSAVATYVCLPPLQPDGCTPTSATYSDPRGIAFNVVTLQTSSGNLKDIYVAVVGWGDGEQDNNFLIGATITKY